MLEPRCRVSQGFLRAFFTVLAIVCCANLVLVWSGSGLLPAANRPAGIVHVVMFEFKSDAAPEQVDAVSFLIQKIKIKNLVARQRNDRRLIDILLLGVRANALAEGSVPSPHNEQAVCEIGYWWD